MRILIAYMVLVLLWSVTPLAIKWSGEGPGYLFGVTGRMVTGLLALILYLLVTRTGLPLDRRALGTYFAGALQIFGSMFLTYWASQYLPSGWIAVVFGLTPLLTAPLSAFFLGEKSLSPQRLLSYLLGIGGLGLMFHSALHFSESASLGIVSILGASFFQALSAVSVKAIRRDLGAMVQVTGSLLVAVPLYLGVYFLLDGTWPENIPDRAIYSILFLGLVATTGGFSLYFYILRNLQAGRVSLITLLTPMLSLYVGDLANHEPITPSVYGGTALIVSALVLYEWEGLKQLIFRTAESSPGAKPCRRRRAQRSRKKSKQRRRQNF
jgi:drug/metabolite transporter (DMT)-like permease